MTKSASSEATVRSNSFASKYRPEIDGLRAFAVVAVIINHFNKDLLPSGYLGVDIFFVISGYVITSSLAGRESKNFLDFLTGFYERRIKRLVPALVVFVLITSALVCLFNPDSGDELELGWRSLFGISNINLYRTRTDYFTEATELNSFTHTWSLGVEEQFYLLFPFLIWFSGFGRQTLKGAKNLFLWVGALTIASLIGFIYLYQVNQPAAYFLMPPRFWEMAAGCLIFIGFQKRARIEQALEHVPPLLVVAAIVGVMFLPVDAAVPATIGVVALSAILIACLKRETIAYQFFTSDKVVHVGLTSYSLYLWHWTVLSISRWTIGIHWWSAPFQIGIMMLIAAGSYRFIEKPIRSTRLNLSRWKTVLTGVATLSASSLVVFSAKNTSANILLGTTRAKEVVYSENKEWNHANCWNYRRLDRIPAATDLEQCWVGGKKQKVNDNPQIKRVFAYGDSYNEQLVPAYNVIAKKNPEVAFHAYYSAGCTASGRLTFSEEKSLGHCARVFHKYMEWFEGKSPRAGDTLLIALSPDYFYTDPKPKYEYFLNRKKISARRALDIYTLELREIAQQLRQKDVRLVLTSGIPVLRYNPNLCSQWYAIYNNKCGVHDLFDPVQTRDVRRINSTLQHGTRKHATWINLFQDLEAIHNSTSMFNSYSNENHLSRAGAFRVEEIISSALIK